VRLAAAAAAAAVLAFGTGSPGAPSPTRLPAPVLSEPGYAQVLAAAGRHAALADGCDVVIVDLVRGQRLRTLPRAGDCRTDPGESQVDDLWLGRGTVAAQLLLAPSPHSASFTLWAGRLSGRPSAIGGAWGWVEDPGVGGHGYGCAWSVAAGGGLVALTEVPNRLAVDRGFEDKPRCPAGPLSRILLRGAAGGKVTVPGAHEILATDGRRLLLAEHDAAGRRTGAATLVGVNGSVLAAPALDPAAVRSAFGGWLTPDGVILETPRAIVGPGWRIAGRAPTATVAEGRVLYLAGKSVRVRRG
jgi:hypothetical protein